MVRTLILEDTAGTDIIILKCVSKKSGDRLFKVEVIKLLLYRHNFSFSKKHYDVVNFKIDIIEHKKCDIQLKNDLQWLIKITTK